MNSSGNLAKNTAYLMTAQVVRVAAQAIFLVAVRRYLGPAAFGSFSVALVIAKLVTQFSELGFSTTLLRDASREPARMRDILGSALGLRTLASAVTLSLLFLITRWLPYSEDVASATMVFGVALILQSFAMLFYAALRSHERMQYEPVALAFYAVVLMSGLAWVIIARRGLVATTMVELAAHLSALLWIAVVAYRILNSAVHLSFNTGLIRSFWRSTWPVSVGTIGYLVYYQADTALLYFIRGAEETGIYSTAYRLVAVSLILPVAYFNALLPRLTRALENNRANARRLLRFSSGGALALGLPLAVGTVMVAPGLMRLLFGESGEPSIRPLQLLIFLAAISYWGQSFTNASLVLDGARIYMRLSCLGAVVNIAANLLVIPRYGYLGACWTTLGTELLVNFLFYLQVRRHLGALGRSGLLARIMAALAGMVFLLWLVSSWPVLLQAAVGALSYVVIFWISGGIRLLGRLRMAE